MTPTPSATNVLRVFRNASVKDYAEGRAWYREARIIAAELDPENIERGAAVLAVLSPQVTWKRNVELAREVYALYARGLTFGQAVDSLRTLKRNADKAVRLVFWSSPPDEAVRGPKVRAFWHTIAHPSDPRAVVVDRHALDVAVGEVLDDARRGGLLGRKGAYDRVAQCYVEAARVLSAELPEPITPAEVQAVTWVAWRRTKKNREE